MLAQCEIIEESQSSKVEFPHTAEAQGKAQEPGAPGGYTYTAKKLILFYVPLPIA